MSSQAKISSFFSTSNKRPLYDNNSDQKTPTKKGKLDKEQKAEKESLSPEQVKRMNENKAAAMEKLKTRRLSQESTELKDLMGKSWYKALEHEFTKSYFTQLCKFVENERSKGTVYPPPHQVYSWTNFSPIEEVKVVILGQDPYHGPKQAHGLCFSVQEGVKSPPSLVNMYKELANDIPGFKIPTHGTLNGWAEQGVLLLNACLTVRASQANSHAGKGWEKLTDAVIAWINKNTTGVVFMLWGAYAQKKGAHINAKNHCILKSVHPSPLSAHRGFLGCQHFSKCNDYLKQHNKTPIDWTHLPPS
ncbi:hypothetical protein LOTGIDRAFT_114279 [Lottia gigantea]|uniref:Uracil-DNA glycosylase n=1 Tax=Lottia gigantea TaxID=225164 RepID=V4AMM3_LOTGI|nr:hypothetical protein LOTGIDRAFT_114279 [Lottia gigantea]ESO98397.1 hypothetical protein LOTGIDRAFT_114279 [Lottia gigantea]